MEQTSYERMMAMLPFQGDWAREFKKRKTIYKQEKARQEKLRDKERKKNICCRD